MIVALLRHPRPLVEPGLCYGRLDLPLHGNAAGQIAVALAVLQRFQGEVWSSPAIRCVAMADAVAQACGVTPRFDARLLELDFGAWEGSAWDDVPRDALDAWAADPMGFAAPGGESGAALVARVTAFYRDLVAGGQDCAVVSHGGPLRVLRALIEGRTVDLMDAPVAIGSVTFLKLQGQQA